MLKQVQHDGLRYAAAILVLLSTTAHARTDPQAAAAFRAAFGKSGSIILKRQGEMSESVRYKPGALVDAPFGPVLISEGKVIEPAHASSGKISAIYLKRAPKGFAVVKRFVPAAESGSFGILEGWAISHAYGPLPVVAVSGGGTWQGYTCGVTTLLELAPDKPRELVTVALYYDDAGAVEPGKRATTITGRIAHIAAGKSFDAVYSGSRRFTEHYVRKGDTYVLPNHAETRMPLC
jgi:hypothetical protein